VRQRRAGARGHRLHRRNARNHLDLNSRPFRFRLARQQLEHHRRHPINAGVAAGHQRGGPPAGGQIERQRRAGQFLAHRRLMTGFTLRQRPEQI